MANPNRVSSIDFWRGAVLIAILVDHIPGNLLEFATPRNFGLSDSAEAFVFLSGLSVGLIYLPRARKHGFETVALACLKRAFKLYRVHLAMTLGALAIFAVAYSMSGVDKLMAMHGRSVVFGSPASGLTGLALLSHQIGYFNILPLYIVLMLWAPLVLALALRDPRLALAVSAGLYLASRALGLHLPNWPEPGGWFFNPFAWQLVFTIGLLCAIVWREGAPRPSPALVALSAALVAAAAFVATDAAGLAPGLRAAMGGHLDLGKQDLGLARLAHFMALAYLIAVAPGLTGLIGGALGRAVQSLGRNSLAIFAAGSLLSAGGQAALTVAGENVPVEVEHFIGLAYTLTCVAALFALARWIECKNQPARAVLTPAGSPSH